MRAPAPLLTYLQLLAVAAPAACLPSAPPSTRHPGARIVDAPGGRKLTGRFLHITDIHPDPYYKNYAATTKEAACHRGSGPAGVYGAELSDCDSPLALVNATFDWIKANLADSVDFVVWTGDSARHDNDETIPRNENQVLDQNRLVVDRFLDVWGKPDNLNDTDPYNDFKIPIVPTFGNNDILPHNIFLTGPNKWTARYLEIWRQFIPEEQRHAFREGGWFHVEVIPNKLVIFSLNTLYFFDSNSGVDGCAIKSEPGYEQFEWLRIQLNFLRIRGVKALIIGHVPPARTENKQSWDETCWQKYTLWMHQYRDVIVGGLYGHMNIEHFMLQDFKQVRKDAKKGRLPGQLGDEVQTLEDEDGEITAQSTSDYLKDLRDTWADLPTAPKGKGKKAKAAEAQYLSDIGGKFGERFSVSHVQASVVPNYFSSLRVFEYNITGLEDLLLPFSSSFTERSTSDSVTQTPLQLSTTQDEWQDTVSERDMIAALRNKKDARENKKKKKKKPKTYKFKVPTPPSSTSPPGPAYSPQPLTLLGYHQYFANITFINNDFHSESYLIGKKWREGKHDQDDVPTDEDGEERLRPEPRPFEFVREYSTFDDKVYKLKDLTVRSYLELAGRIGESKKAGQKTVDGADGGAEDECVDEEDEEDESGEEQASGKKDKKKKDKKKKKKDKKHKKKKKDKRLTRTWYTFLKRAYVSALPPEDIRDEFGGDGKEDFDFDNVDVDVVGLKVDKDSISQIEQVVKETKKEHVEENWEL